MSVSALDRIQGAHYQLVLETEAGNISISQHTDIDFEESPDSTGSNTSEGWDDLKVFTKRKAKLTIKGLRGLNNCYSDLPEERQKIVDIRYQLVDEEGDPIAGEDMKNPVYDQATNPKGYKRWAVESKRGSTKDADNADFELVLSSGWLNAKP